MSKNIFILLVVLQMILPQAVSADSLGRLFTDEQERRRLDIVRNQEPVEDKPAVITEVELFEPEPEPEVEKVPELTEALYLKGLVHRSDGKNTAWVNNSNSLEGNLENQYITVPEEGVGNDHVNIVMPDGETRIKLKVGDSYEPPAGSEATPEPSRN